MRSWYRSNKLIIHGIIFFHVRVYHLIIFDNNVQMLLASDFSLQRVTDGRFVIIEGSFFVRELLDFSGKKWQLTEEPIPNTGAFERSSHRDHRGD